MRAHAELTASAPPPGRAAAEGWRLTWVRDAPPFAFRPTPEAVYLVGTAASPVGQDELSLAVTVEKGARLTVRSVASTIAWASSGSRVHMEIDVQAGAVLDWQLQPMVVSRSCSLVQRCVVHMAAGASLRWGEEVVLGRYKEEPGRLTLRLDVDIDGAPLLRHQLDVGPGASGWDGPAVLGGNRAVGLVLTAGAGDAPGEEERARGPKPPASQTAGDGWAAMPLEGPGHLVQAAAPNIALLREKLRLAEAAPRCASEDGRD